MNDAARTSRQGYQHIRSVGWRGGAFLGIIALAWSTAPAAGPPDELPQMQWEVIPNADSSIEALLERADRAAAQNLFIDADQLYRMVLEREPANNEAYRSLLALWENRRLPVDSDALENVSALLPEFTQLKSKHFVIVSDAPGYVIQGHATRLERTLHEFNRDANRLDLRPLPLRYRLVCVLFDERDDYAAFARSHDDIHADWIAGYYTPKHDRAVFYNAHSNPGVLKAHDDLANLESNVQDARQQARQASRKGEASNARQMHREIEQYRQHLNQQRREVEQFTEHLSTATTVHETVHQLMFHTQVQSPYVEYPFWISEGLATAFETESISTSFGPDFEFDLRRDAFEELVRNEQLVDLQSFVTIIRPPTGDPNAVHILYHQSYALVTWMHRYRRAGLVKYMNLMRSHEPGRLTEPENVRIFERAFGNIAQLERAWLKEERSRID